jgi:hypothetical protein
MNKIEFKRLIKTLVKEEMAKKKMMEVETMPFTKKGSGKIKGDEFGYSEEEDIEKSPRKKSFGEKTMDAIKEIVAKILKKDVKKVTADEVELYKKMKK